MSYENFMKWTGILFFAVGLALTGKAHATIQIEICAGSPDGSCKHPDATHTSEVDSGGSNDAKAQVGDEAGAIRISTPSGQGWIQMGNVTGNLPTPTGWTDPATPPATAGAPITGLWYDGTAGNRDLDPHVVCQRYTPPSGGSYVGITPDPPTGANATCNYKKADGTTSSLTIGKLGATCPTGYTNTSGTCTLSSASSVVPPADGKCTISRSGTVYSANMNDPDCAAGVPAKFGSDYNIAVTSAGSPAAGTAKGTGATSATGGNGISCTIDASSKGTTCTGTTPNPSNSSQSYSWSISFSQPDATHGGNAVITGMSSQLVQGSGTAVTTTPVTSAPDIDVSSLAKESTLESTNSKLDQANSTLSDIKTGQCGGTNPDGSAQPACRTSIDETGTPDGSTAYNGARSDLDTAESARNDGMNSVTSSDGKDTSWGWTVSFPTTACSAIPVGSSSIDVCRQVPILQQLLSWIYGIATFLLCAGMVKGAIQGGA